MAVFYISYLVFLPSKRGSLQIPILLMSFCLLAYADFKIHDWLFGGTHKEVFFIYIFSYVTTYGLLFLFAYALFSIKEIYKKQRALEVANREKKMAELRGLKAQINPHFLFNTLNAIYSIALKKDDRTADLIMKLSDNFRYILFAEQEDYVSLKNEIDYMKDYVSLQSARLADKLEAIMTFDVEDSGKPIAPLLMMPFIENAFKYSSSLRGKGHKMTIKVSLKEGQFNFYCSNPFGDFNTEGMDHQWQSSGIGISNAKRRLETLYPNRHNLRIQNNLDTFIVDLTITL
ncbi:histidine kinase [Flagellimonas lutimaris]|uniref:Histidine kinase n=2 Tax=Flagellimonas lutimaris TaxID=475082 RepID=A0A3A1N5L3_9FLAO|nr:histidine kinase [Allomuricauda lutimaris]